MTRRMLILPALALCGGIWFTSVPKLGAQMGARAQKFEQIATQLKLTPQQKMQLVPILEQEAPKVAAIKADTSLTKIQKLQQLRAIRAQNDPKVRSILTSDQYQELQKIRHQEIEQGIRHRMNP